jgi:phenylpropionate dioxygenase-like ring-hydroxylating dioxygenase large terminal subunit
MTLDLSPADLITEDWRVHGSIYTDPQIFAREQQALFHGPWLYVAHESEISHPGDYKTTFAGTQPVIVARGADDGEIRVLLNRCRHRGASVCQDEAGNANYFRCPYHGWTYRNSGELRGITYDAAYGDIDRSTLGLVRLPRVASYAGFVFASFAPDGPSLEEYLGNAAPYLDIVSQQGPEGIRLSAGSHRLTYNGNWKLQIENTIDCYHFSFTHKSWLDILKARGSARNFAQNVQRNEGWRTLDLGQGHAAHEYGPLEDHAAGEGVANFSSGELLPFNLVVFPSLAFVGAHLRVVVPVSATRTRVFLYPMMPRGFSEQERAQVLRSHEGFYGPSGAGSDDDIEVGFERVMSGLEATATTEDWVLMSRGVNRERLDEQTGIRYGRSADELPQRAFYRRWMELLAEELDG